jgi:hypothetical protein
MASVRKTASKTADIWAWNSVAMALTQKVRMKKSKASSDHPRRQAINVLRCATVRRRKCPRNSMVRSLAAVKLYIDRCGRLADAKFCELSDGAAIA